MGLAELKGLRLGLSASGSGTGVGSGVGLGTEHVKVSQPKQASGPPTSTALRVGQALGGSVPSNAGDPLLRGPLSASTGHSLEGVFSGQPPDWNPELGSLFLNPRDSLLDRGCLLSYFSKTLFS